MYIYGANWLTRLDTEEGLKNFTDLYGESPYKVIVDHEVFHITRIFPHKYRHIAFVESDGEVNCVFTLRDGEHLMVYSDGCMGEERVFNTDGMAFIRLIRDSKKVAFWAVENSPYDYTVEDQSENEVSTVQLYENIEKAIKISAGENEIEFDSERVLVVGQL